MAESIEGVEGIIFELDSVLFDKSDWVLPATEYAAQQMRLDPQKAMSLASEYIASHGGADPQIYNAILIGCGQFDTAMNIRAFTSLVNQFQPASRSIGLYPGVEEALQLIRDSHRLAIVTDGPPDAQKRKVIALGLHELIPTVIFSDEIEGIKSRLPDQRPLLAAAAQLRLEPQSILFVGHNPVKHFQRPRELGFVTMRVMNGEYGRHDYPSEEHRADYDLPSVAGLVHLLPQPQAKAAIQENPELAGWGVERSWAPAASADPAPSAESLPQGAKFEDAAFAALFEMTDFSLASMDTAPEAPEPPLAAQQQTGDASFELPAQTMDEAEQMEGAALEAPSPEASADYLAESEEESLPLADLAINEPQPDSSEDLQLAEEPGLLSETGPVPEESFTPGSAGEHAEAASDALKAVAEPELLASLEPEETRGSSVAQSPSVEPAITAPEAKKGDDKDDDNGVLDFSTL